LCDVGEGQFGDGCGCEEWLDGVMRNDISRGGPDEIVDRMFWLREDSVGGGAAHVIIEEYQYYLRKKIDKTLIIPFIQALTGLRMAAVGRGI
jgi:hypothetical protein